MVWPSIQVSWLPALLLRACGLFHSTHIQIPIFWVSNDFFLKTKGSKHHCFIAEHFLAMSIRLMLLWTSVETFYLNSLSSVNGQVSNLHQQVWDCWPISCHLMHLDLKGTFWVFLNLISLEAKFNNLTKLLSELFLW